MKPSMLISFLAFMMLALVLPHEGRAQTIDVAGTYSVGIAGTQGNNTGDLLNAVNFSTMDLDITFFVFDTAGYGGSQGNDIAGFIRFLTHDNQILDISGAINWQIKVKGKTQYFGLSPDSLTTPITFQNSMGQSFTFDSNTNFAIRIDTSTLVIPDGTDINGAANPPNLNVLNINTFPYDPNNPPDSAKRRNPRCAQWHNNHQNL